MIARGTSIPYASIPFTGWLPVIQNPETKNAKKYRESEISEQNTFSIENGMIVTTGTPDGYVRTTDVYDNYVFHVEVLFPRNRNSGALIHSAAKPPGEWNICEVCSEEGRVPPCLMGS